MQLFSECGEVDFNKFIFFYTVYFQNNPLIQSNNYYYHSHVYIILIHLWTVWLFELLFGHCVCMLHKNNMLFDKFVFIFDSKCIAYNENGCFILFILSCEKWQLALYIYVWMNFDMHDRMIRLQRFTRMFELHCFASKLCKYVIITYHILQWMFRIERMWMTRFLHVQFYSPLVMYICIIQFII